ncbi:hypothetical protein KIPB_006713 [Kipferlia bialata]|uniref:Uncharacterized protein n=1 Tax=Kipferlia bialata TaxID=797122 RepID=A0A9K3GJB0_9EUKA|nr:hypothetical protein KIPB_006713 [Kipferlia bialata]|eukprot:g6713.t1
MNPIGSSITSDGVIHEDLRAYEAKDEIGDWPYCLTDDTERHHGKSDFPPLFPTCLGGCVYLLDFVHLHILDLGRYLVVYGGWGLPGLRGLRALDTVTGPTTLLTVGCKSQDAHIVTVSPERLYPHTSLLWATVEESQRVVYPSDTGDPRWRVATGRVFDGKRRQLDSNCKESIGYDAHGPRSRGWRDRYERYHGCLEGERATLYRGFSPHDWVREMGDTETLRRERDRRVAEAQQWREDAIALVERKYQELEGMIGEECTRLEGVRERMGQVGQTVETGTGYLTVVQCDTSGADLP